MRLIPCLRLRYSEVLLNQPSQQFVPKHKPVVEAEVKRLEEFLFSKPNVLVLTGAGISTESGKQSACFNLIRSIMMTSANSQGIPDYRSEGVGMYARTTHRPVQQMEFLSSAKVRQRYWARNFVAWPRFSNFQPNATHLALARFEREGRLSGIVTQNVDQLHRKAGSTKVTELHGHGYSVICLGTGCNYRIGRHEFQDILHTVNASMTDRSEMIRPDGDVDIPQVDVLCTLYSSFN